MVFQRLANIVTRRHKMILIIWIVALLCLLPAISKVNDVLVYQESEMVSGDLESLVAQNIIDEQFPTQLANSTLMVVLQDQDVGSAESRNFCLELQALVTAPGSLAYLDDFSSVYSASESMIYSLASEMGPAMYQTEYQINVSVSLLYGIPSLYLISWVSTDPGLSIPERDSAAYGTTISAMPYMLAGFDIATAQLAYLYFDAFSFAWNSSSSDPVLTANPPARAEAAIGSAGPSFVAGLAYPEDQKAVMYAALSSFNLTTYTNLTLIHAFSVSTVAGLAGIENLTFMEGIYGLGPSPTVESLSAFSHSVIANSTLAELPVQLPPEYLSSLVSPDNSTTLIVLSFSKDSDFWEGGEQPIVNDVDVLRSMVAQTKADHQSSDLQAYVTGDAALTSDMQSSMGSELMLIEPITIIIIVVLMGIFFRSVVAQFLPLGGVMVALGVSQAFVFFVGALVADVHYIVVTLLFSILMGVGTDYAIFILARYREERIKGHNREEAVRTSVTWAGESIATSGATVMISFFTLGIADFSMIKTMGIVLGVSIGISLLVALTLVPSLIMLFGNWIFWPNRGARWYKFAARFMERRSKGQRGYFFKAATFSIKHAKAVFAAAVLISIPTTYVFTNAETSFDFIGGMSSSIESNKGIVAMTDGFGAGRIMPSQILVVFDTPVYADGNFSIEKLQTIDTIVAAVAATENVKQVTGPTNPQGDHIDYANISSMPADARASVEAKMLQTIGIDNCTVMLTVVLEQGPMTPESLNTIVVLRDEMASLTASDSNLASSTVYVAGSTAIIHDLKVSLDKQFQRMEIMVVIGIFIVLLIVLGAVLLSLFAIISIMLSITWAFAATVGIFGYWLGEPILWIIPIILFIMLMGIGMDYNIFILTRIREEIHRGKNDKDAVVESLDWTGGIITALAIIMGSAFSMMMISSTMMLKEIGFALAFAILLDAMVVRTYVVPAIMTILGKRAWWAPGRLQRERRAEKKPSGK